METGRHLKANHTNRGSKKKSNNNNTTKEMKEKNTKETKVLLADSQSNSEEGFSVVLDPGIESILDEMIRGLLSPGPLGSEMDAMLLCGSEGSEGSEGWVQQKVRILNEERGSGADMVNEERESEPTGTQLDKEEEVGSAQTDTSNLLDWDKLEWDMDLGQEWSYCDSTVDFRIPCMNINNGNDLESLTSWLMSDLF